MKIDRDVRTGNINRRSIFPEEHEFDAADGFTAEVDLIDRALGNRILVSRGVVVMQSGVEIPSHEFLLAPSKHAFSFGIRGKDHAIRTDDKDRIDSLRDDLSCQLLLVAKRRFRRFPGRDVAIVLKHDGSAIVFDNNHAAFDNYALAVLGLMS